MSEQNSLSATDVTELSDVRNQVVMAEMKVLSEGFGKMDIAKKVDHVYNLVDKKGYTTIMDNLKTLTKIEKLGWEGTEWAKKP